MPVSAMTADSRNTLVPATQMPTREAPDAVDFTDAAAAGCRLMTAYHGIVEVGQIHPGDWLVAVQAAWVCRPPSSLPA